MDDTGAKLSDKETVGQKLGISDGDDEFITVGTPYGTWDRLREGTWDGCNDGHILGLSARLHRWWYSWNI